MSRLEAPEGSLLDAEVNKVVPSCQTKALQHRRNNKPCRNASPLADFTGDRKDVVVSEDVELGLQTTTYLEENVIHQRWISDK